MNIQWIDGVAQPADASLAEAWHAAAQAKVLLIQRCSNCARWQFYPRPFCTVCSSSRVEWVEASGRGVVLSWTVVRRAPRKGVSVPYVLAVIELDEGVKMLSRVVDCAPELVECDLPVEVDWQEAAGSGQGLLPMFRPVAAS